MSEEAQFRTDFAKNYPNYVRLNSSVESILSGAMAKLNIDSLPVSHRIKDVESALAKMTSKTYENVFEEITDFVAFRVIVYLESDIEEIEKCVRQLFTIDEENSVDKRTSKRVNEFGYRSLHLICQLGKDRANLQEYADIADQKFEIQIRTVLQHAWAEIEHKKNYKGTDSLPSDLERRLMTVAGTLELLDKEFSDISLQATEYVKLIQSDAPSTSDDKLTSLAVDSVFESFVQRILNKKIDASYASTRSKEGILKELVGFGIKTPSDLKQLLDNEFARELLQIDRRAQKGLIVGFLRSVMMIEDADKYFSDGFASHGFDSIAPLTLELIEEVTSDETIRERILKHVRVAGF